MKKPAKVFSNDRYLDFVLANWKDVHAFTEAVTRAQERLPHWLTAQVKDVFAAMQHTYFNKAARYSTDETDNSCIWWDTCGRYDRVNMEGPYLGFFYDDELGNVWDWVKERTPECVPHLVFAVDVGGSKKRATSVTQKWSTYVNKHKHTMLRKGIEINLDPTPSEWLARRDLGSVFTLEKMLDVTTFREAFERAIVEFTGTMHPIIKSGPRM